MKKCTNKVILLVEDHPDSRMLVNVILTKQGYTVVESENIDAMILWIGQNSIPDLILLDYHTTTGMNGSDAVIILRKAPGYELTPIVFVSGLEDIAQISSSCDVQGFLEKPFSIQGLIQKVSSFFDVDKEIT